MSHNIVIMSRKHISAHVLDQIAGYRYRIFVEQLGWRLPADHANRRELDSFDDSANVHYLAVYSRDVLIGTARLTPADQPNVSRNVFPGLFDVPVYEVFRDAWEISRMSVTLYNSYSNRSQIALEILRICQEFAVSRGACQLVGVTFSKLIAKWRRAGMDICASGREIVCDGVSTSGFFLQSGRSAGGIPFSSIEMAGSRSLRGRCRDTRAF
ncbi:acyl-homoserine-lactone synthase [Salinisphaera sp. RV14]|uniref:acyl-homoserine-lactone synthase n=1 Tax=Salinisphaera sp. RV14 TaxID=3454140 RepID=UPI003F825364